MRIQITKGRASGEGAMPRHLFNRMHWMQDPFTPIGSGEDYAAGLCGAKGGEVLSTKKRSDVTCKRCLKMLVRRGV